MNRKIFAILFAAHLLFFACSGNNEYDDVDALDLRKCSIQVGEAALVGDIKTIEGDFLQAKEGRTKLIEIKINNHSNDKGYYFMHKDLPKLLCLEKEEYSVLNAIAVAIKFKHHETGELIEKYHNEATMLITVEVEENIDYYAVFEVPLGVQEYQLMLPTKCAEIIN